MIPNIKSGSSFRGAGAYYLHDKSLDAAAPRAAKPQSDARVMWSETRNCVNDEPALAIDEMWKTAADAPRLKQQAGHSQGRPCTKPVKTISLAWHPDETPDRAAMVAAVDSYLLAMGWQDHQALIVAHNDTKHPHVHIILNTVHPDTGLTLNATYERRRSQQWAHAYEKEHGQIWCVDRAVKYDQHVPDLNPSGMPRDYHDQAKAPVQQFETTEAVLELQDKAQRASLGERHRLERDQFFEERRAIVKAIRQGVYQLARERYRDTWTAHYHLADLTTTSAARHALAEEKRAAAATRARRRDEARTHLASRNAVSRAARTGIATQRAELRRLQKDDTRDRQNLACAAFINHRYDDYAALKTRQQHERAELKALQSRQHRGEPFDAARLTHLTSVPQASPDLKIERHITTIKRYIEIAAELPRVGNRTMDPQTNSSDDDARRRDTERQYNIEQFALRQNQATGQHLTQREQELLTDLDTQQRKITDYLDARRADADKARQEEDQRQQGQGRDQQAPDATRDAGQRYREAIGRYYDITRPYSSLAQVAGYEHELFAREQQSLKEQIAATPDPMQRRTLELRQLIESHQYVAQVSGRVAAMTDIIVGRVIGEQVQGRGPDYTPLNAAAQRVAQRIDDRITATNPGIRHESDADLGSTKFNDASKQRERQAFHAEKAATYKEALQHHLLMLSRHSEQTTRSHTEQEARTQRTQSGEAKGLNDWVADMAQRRQHDLGKRFGSKEATSTRDPQADERQRDDQRRRERDRGRGGLGH